MPIDDDVLAPRYPKLGTITLGMKVQRNDGKGMRPAKADTLVFHTDDPDVADAVETRFGGEVTDGDHWSFEVVTEVTSAPVTFMPSGFRQWLELWATAECLRRCDGKRMSRFDGGRVDRPCLCDREVEDGDADTRSCSPTTVLPVLVELDVPRLAMWEVRSTSYGSARSIKGAVAVLENVGVGPDAQVSAHLHVKAAKVRDGDGQVWDTNELHVMATGVDADADPIPAMEGEAPALPSDDERATAALLDRWEVVLESAKDVGVYEQVRQDWRDWRDHEDQEPADLDVDRLRDWVQLAEATVADADDGQ